MIFITFQRCSGKGVYFRGVFGHFGVQIGAPRAGMSSASLDVDEIGLSIRSSVGKNLGPLQHDYDYFSKVLGKMHLFWGCI